jgi:protein O-GlcNAc transferase
MSGHAGTQTAVRSILERALDCHRRRDLARAEALYREALRVEPRQADALHLLGVLTIQTGRMETGIELIGRSIEANPYQPDVHFNRGNALCDLQRFEDAIASYERALQLRPEFPAALLRLGNALMLLNRSSEALQRYDAMLRLAPEHAGAWSNRGNALQSLARPLEAIASYDRALQLEPQFADALVNRGNALRLVKRPEDALADYDRSLALNPESAQAHNARGSALRDLKRPQEALASYDEALRRQPRFAEAHNNRGNAWRDLRRPEDALGAYERALALKPGFADALSNRGIVLRELRCPDDALVSLELARQLDPHSADIHINLGGALFDLKRSDEALASYARARQMQPDDVDALTNHALALREYGHFGEAADSFRRVCELAPDYDYALGLALDAALNCGDWTDYDARRDRIVAAVQDGRRVDPSFEFLALSESAAAQLQCARTYARDRNPCASERIWRGEAYRHERIRVAYLSADLREHAVSYLMAGVFERHDRTRFELLAFSLQLPDGSPMGARVRAAFDRFIDISRMSDLAVARLMRELEVDIVVDLMGFTRESRQGILAHRPAAVQVAYLGLPGTSGADYIDYLIADEYLIPPDAQQHYSECVVCLPHCFQANDDRRAIGPLPTRGQVGLPEQALVFCCFNHVYKINPPLFDVWCRLLRRNPHSVLWLLAHRADIRENLYREAAQRGIDRGRLVMAERVPYPQHLGRLGVADLFLDTVPFNAGTTASDALWAGLPVLTCTGEAFASRMAGSLLRTLELPELITSSLADYERRANEFSDHPERLAQLRSRLALQRERAPLFKTEQFCRYLEAAYTRMWHRAESGAPPAPIVIPA